MPSMGTLEDVLAEKAEELSRGITISNPNGYGSNYDSESNYEEEPRGLPPEERPILERIYRFFF